MNVYKVVIPFFLLWKTYGMITYHISQKNNNELNIRKGFDERPFIEENISAVDICKNLEKIKLIHRIECLHKSHNEIKFLELKNNLYLFDENIYTEECIGVSNISNGGLLEKWIFDNNDW